MPNVSEQNPASAPAGSANPVEEIVVRQLVRAWIDADHRVAVQLSSAVNHGEIGPGHIRLSDATGRTYGIAAVESNTSHFPTHWLCITTTEGLPFTRHELQLSILECDGTVPLVPREVLLDGNRFHSPDAEMGAICTPEHTTFRLFAPTADRVQVVLYDAWIGKTNRRVHGLERRPRGLWELTLSGDFHEQYYTYVLTGHELNAEREVIDPYAKCCNGRDGCGIIVDMERTNPPGFDPRRRPILNSENNVVIYELHVRDASIHPDSGIEMKGKFLGLAERGTYLTGNPAITTGLDHLAELGPTHVQLLPIQDFDNDEESQTEYNWGYMPSNWFSPDGWYATSSWDISRITEFKTLVQAMHNRGLRVVMDVVFNHTDHRSAFDHLVPGYYYRMTEDGFYSNGSGCGNEFRSEAPMARKLIVDCCALWAREYGVDGFRFDLMALTDRDTMFAVRDALHEIDSTILVWGEPWMAAASRVPVPMDHYHVRGSGMAAFNDTIRDLIKGSTRGGEGGFVQHGSKSGELSRHVAGAVEAHTQHPTEAVQYVTAHDDNVLWDKLQLSAGHESEDVRKRMQMMCGAILLTSQGKIFLHAGCEMLRTKQMNDNSYNAPDAINQIDWNWKAQHRDAFLYHRGLIAIRKAHPVFHLTDRVQVRRRMCFEWELPNHRSLGYHLDGRGLAGEEWAHIHVIHNADTVGHAFNLKEGRWNVVAHDGKAGLETLFNAEGQIDVPAWTSAILWRSHLPGHEQLSGIHQAF
jgi:pullulanase